MTETDAKQVLEQLFAFGDVAVQAFIEQQGNASTEVVVVEPFVVAGSMLTPTTFAAA
jgi:glutathione synthase/RimK-type ligase-like ATP-grasp enzyme